MGGLETFGGNVDSANTQFIRPTEKPKQTFAEMAKDIGENLDGKREQQQFLQENALSPSLARARSEADRLLQESKTHQTVLRLNSQKKEAVYDATNTNNEAEQKRDALATLLLAGVEVTIGSNGEFILQKNKMDSSESFGFDSANVVTIPADKDLGVLVKKDKYGRREVVLSQDSRQMSLSSFQKPAFSAPLLASADDFVGNFAQGFDAFSTNKGVENKDYHLHIADKGVGGTADLILSKFTRDAQGALQKSHPENTLISLSPSENGELPLGMEATLSLLPGTAIFKHLQKVGKLTDTEQNTPNGVQKVTMPVEEVFALLKTLKSA